MSINDRVTVVCAGMDSEELYFQQQEQERLRKLKAKAEEAAGDKYRDEHKYHCFRCGTASLAEVENQGVKIDVCVNCGAVHLDPGEMEALSKKDSKSLSRMSLAVINIFK